ncbi:MAG TPA: lipid-A-disaccharide synthase, partial [Firmicutes bacterium]|nr:lipid-A-disaccharide synthase [Bacillota bacterium]
MKIMLVAGEASGDYYGSGLIKALKEIGGEIEFFGWGGKLMAQEGMELIFDPTNLSPIGFTEVVKLLGFYKKWLKRLEQYLIQRRPNCLVLIDFPGFNMRLAKIAKRLDIPCVYFIPPSAWAWGENRAKKVANTVNKVAAILPMEIDVYQKAGADVVMVGHPLLEEIPEEIDRAKACNNLKLNDKQPVLAVIPGSRMQEIKTHFQLMLEACQILKQEIPKLQVILPKAPTIERKVLEDMAKESNLEINIIEGQTHMVIAAATVCLCTGGTVTLEAALLARPMVNVYKLSKLSFMLVQAIVKVDYFTLPNVILNKKIVPELIQDDFTVQNMVDNLRPLLIDSNPNQEIASKLKEIRPMLGQKGCYRNTARIIWEVACSAGSNN